jgi:hypothetical protein
MLYLTAVLELVGEPLKTLNKTVTRVGARGRKKPCALAEVMKVQLVCDFSSVHCIGKILFVGKDEEKSITELVFVEHTVELFTSLGNTQTIVRVDDKDDSLCVLEVVPPERTDLVLTTDIPHGEVDVPELYRLDVKSDGRDCCDNLAKLELVENRSFTSTIETDHENAHLRLDEQACINKYEYAYITCTFEETKMTMPCEWILE